jgi:hypothetical protein
MTATNIQAIADKMVSSGLAAAGYTYVNLDDCWAKTSRMSDGSISGSPAEFPSMKALASYVHAKGLMFGLYTSENNQTCAGRPGSYGYSVYTLLPRLEMRNLSVVVPSALTWCRCDSRCTGTS